MHFALTVDNNIRFPYNFLRNIYLFGSSHYEKRLFLPSLQRRGTGHAAELTYTALILTEQCGTRCRCIAHMNPADFPTTVCARR